MKKMRTIMKRILALGLVSMLLLAGCDGALYGI